MSGANAIIAKGSDAHKLNQRCPVEKLRHLPQLSGLRGVAVLLVITCHSFGTEVRGIGWLDAILHKCDAGWCGVDLFFCLSGFLLTRILLQTKGQAQYFINFYTRRALRIFPLYYSLALVYSVSELIHKSVRILPTLMILLYGTNFYLGLMHNRTLCLGGLRATHLWSLAVEEQFYLVWPVAVALLTPNRLRQLILLLIVGIAVVRTIYVSVTHDTIVPYFMLRFDAVLFGAWIAVQTAYSLKTPNHNRLLFASVALIEFALFLGTSLDASNAWVATIGYSINSAFFALLIAFAVRNPENACFNRFLSNSLFTSFGKYSYALYLFHYPLLHLCYSTGVDAWLSKLVPSATGGMLFARLVELLATFTLALISWNLLERPMLAFNSTANIHSAKTAKVTASV